jgi:hypothetical protein
MKLTVMMRRLKKRLGRLPWRLHDDVARGRARHSAGADALFFMIQMLVRVLDHDDRAVDHHADGDRDAAQAHDVGVDAEQVHHQQADEHAAGNDEDGDQFAAGVQKKERMQTSATTSISSISVWRSVWMARSIRSERS